MADIYSADFKFKPIAEGESDGWLSILAKASTTALKDGAKSVPGAVLGTGLAIDGWMKMGGDASTIADLATTVSNTVMGKAPDILPVIQNIASALFEAVNAERKERSKIVKLDPKLKKLFYAPLMKRYIKNECDKLFQIAKAKDGTLTKEVIGASTKASKTLVGKKEQEVRKKISKFREVTMTIDGYDLIVFGRKDGISRVAVVFFSNAKKAPVLKTIKIPTMEELKKGKSVKESAEEIEALMTPVDEGWVNLIAKLSKYTGHAIMGAGAGLVLSLVCPAAIAIPLCATIGGVAPELKAISDKKLKSLLEQPAVKKQLIESCKKIFAEAKKEDPSVVREFENGVKTVLGAIKDESKQRSIKQKLTNFSKAKMTIDGWSIIAFGTSKSIERVSLVLWSNEHKKAVVKSLPVPTLNNQEVKECCLAMENLYPEEFAGAHFNIDLEYLKETLNKLNQEKEQVITEGLMDKAAELYDKFNREIKPVIIEKLKWLYDKIVAIIQKINIFTKVQVAGLHIEIGDNRALNELSGYVSMIMKLASKVSDRNKVYGNLDKFQKLVDEISDHKSSSKNIQTRAVKKWLEDLSKFTLILRDAMKESGTVIMGNSTEEEFDVYMAISSTLTPLMGCIGEDLNTLSMALNGKPEFEVYLPNVNHVFDPDDKEACEDYFTELSGKIKPVGFKIVQNDYQIPPSTENFYDDSCVGIAIFKNNNLKNENILDVWLAKINAKCDFCSFQAFKFNDSKFYITAYFD